MDKANQPFVIALVSYSGVRRNNVDPRSTRMQRNKVILCIHEVHRAQQASPLFPFAIRCGPIDLERLSIPEKVGGLLLTEAEIYF